MSPFARGESPQVNRGLPRLSVRWISAPPDERQKINAEAARRGAGGRAGEVTRRGTGPQVRMNTGSRAAEQRRPERGVRLPARSHRTVGPRDRVGFKHTLNGLDFLK